MSHDDPLSPAVLIVGAGPVGLTLAIELTRFGVPVRIIDRAANPTQTSKALVVWSRTLELLDRMGLAAVFLGAGLRARGASMRTGRTILGRVGFDNIRSPYNFALLIPQRETERILTTHLLNLGVTVEREVELLGFDGQPSHVVATLRNADKTMGDAAVGWLVGCDGAHSTVRHNLKLEFKGKTQGNDWLLADVRLQGDGVPPADEIATHLHRDGPCVIFPLPGGRARIVATRGPATPQPRPVPTLADVQALTDERTGGGFSVLDPIWLANFRINDRKVSEYRRGRIFLAGDAAHVHSPAGGQGMNTGIQDAINLAWKLAMVCHGDAAAGLLDSYTPERSAVGDMVLRNAVGMTGLGTLSHPAAQATRNIALRVMLGFNVVRDRVAMTMSETEIAYRDSPLSAGRHAGNRLPPESYDGPPPGSGSRSHFVMYAADGSKAAALAARFPRLIDTAPRSSPDPSQILIVRPDGYVGLATDAADWTAVGSYLQSLQG